MLLREIERIRASKKIDHLILATSFSTSDDPLEKLASDADVSLFRGNLDDVLDRFYQAVNSLPFKVDYIVRLTGDCPLIDPDVIDKTIRHCIDNDYDYVSCALNPTFPDGLDTEVFRFSCLKTAWEEAKLTSEREHVTPYIYSHPDKFRIGSFTNNENLSSLRWTVDEPEDFEFVSHVYETLYPTKPEFRMSDILDLIKTNPDFSKKNTHIKRNEGYEKSLANDSIFKKGK